MGKERWAKALYQKAAGVGGVKMKLIYTINAKITCIYDSDKDFFLRPKKFANNMLKLVCDEVGKHLDGVATAEIEEARVFVDENDE